MCNNGLCGGNLCWIIILLVLFCGCGTNNWMGSGCGNNGLCATPYNNGCDNNCGCC